MAWFGFTMRRKERDDETDRMRKKLIVDMLAQHIDSIDAERRGLQERYERAAASAAFSLETMENGNASLSPKVDALSLAMSRFSQRLACLDAQSAFLTKIRESVLAFRCSGPD